MLIFINCAIRNQIICHFNQNKKNFLNENVLENASEMCAIFFLPQCMMHYCVQQNANIIE